MAPDTDDRATEIRVDLLLDEAAREANLWDRARGRAMRLTYEDVGYLLAAGGFLALYFWNSSTERVPASVTGFVLAVGVMASWQSHRLSRRIDALARLLEKQKGRV